MGGDVPMAGHGAGWAARYFPTQTILWFFSMEKRRLQGDLTVAFQYLKGAYRQEGGQLYTWVNNDRTRGDYFK